MMLPFPEKAVGFNALMMIMRLIRQGFRILDTRTREKMKSPKIATCNIRSAVIVLPAKFGSITRRGCP
jgi:hypothetical protein